MYDARAYLSSVWMSGPLSTACVFEVVSGKIIARRRKVDRLFQESFRFVELAAFGQSPSEVILVGLVSPKQAASV